MRGPGATTGSSPRGHHSSRPSQHPERSDQTVPASPAEALRARSRDITRPKLTVQPTPNTCGVMRWGLSGAQRRSCARANVGRRKSYGTKLATFPVQVRSLAGLDSSLPIAATSSAALMIRASHFTGDDLCVPFVFTGDDLSVPFIFTADDLWASFIPFS